METHENIKLLRESQGLSQEALAEKVGYKDRYQRGTDAARVIQVIETKAVRGSGEKNQPFRTVIEYWSFDGKKLGEIDPLISAAE